MTQNEIYRDLIRPAVRNHIPFTYVLNDVQYALEDNTLFINHETKRNHFFATICVYLKLEAVKNDCTTTSSHSSLNSIFVF